MSGSRSSSRGSDSATLNETRRWSDVRRFVERPGPLAHPQHEPKEAWSTLQDLKVLVIGAGGLGCELLKNLALSGFRNMEVIDMDRIDVSNLNRQFLFRAPDVNKSKAEVAAKFVNDRVPGANVIPYFGRIEDKDDDYYRKFNLVIAGLDSVDARRWISSKLVDLVEVDADGNITDPSTVIPLIDGGTEGFKGQARLILPRLTCCFECTLESFPPQKTFAFCTIAQTPRQPEHCVEYISSIVWPRERPKEQVDGDNPEHMKWIHERAVARAGEYNIAAPSFQLTQGVVKNIIPAVASTNAIVAAMCCSEAVKLASNAAMFVNNYVMYSGGEGTYTYTFPYERLPDCIVCGRGGTIKLRVNPEDTLRDVIESWAQHPRLQARKPSVRTTGKDSKTLYMQKPPFLEKSTRPNLDKTMQELMPGPVTHLGVTDPSLPTAVFDVELTLDPAKRRLND